MFIVLFLKSPIEILEFFIILILISLIVFLILKLKNKHQHEIDQQEINNNKFKSLTKDYNLQLEKHNLETERLKNLWEFKEGVTHLLLHDLKNPLSLIINYNSFSKELLGHAAGQMMNIVTGISDVQNSENAKLNIDLKEVQIHSVLNEAYCQVELLFDEYNLTYQSNIEEDLLVYADEKLLERVFVNLLLNAIKFAPHKGGIKVIAEQNKDKIKISVIDTGIVIPEDIHDLVFDKFGLLIAKNSDAARVGNLGLSFCKLAIESHNESIGITSDKDQTVFWFTLKATSSNYKLNKESTLQHNKTELLISDESKHILHQFIIELKSFEVYEFTAIRKIIKQIEELENPDIKMWVDKLKQIVKSGDEESYSNMIEKIE